MVQIVIMRPGVVLRTASMEALREASTEALREAIKGRERYVPLHVICHVKVHVRSIYTLDTEK
jgi:hypothetical protein